MSGKQLLKRSCLGSLSPEVGQLLLHNVQGGRGQGSGAGTSPTLLQVRAALGPDLVDDLQLGGVLQGHRVWSGEEFKFETQSYYAKQQSTSKNILRFGKSYSKIGYET